MEALKEQLLPLATLLTPNIPEAQVLSGMTITTAEDMERAAQAISETYGCAVLCKGGHQIHDADDLLWRDGQSTCSVAAALITPIPTAPAVRSPAPSPPTWPKAMT